MEDVIESVEPAMKVNLFISARNLTDLDIITVSDPQCRVEEIIDGQGTTPMKKVLGKTEIIKNNLNPNWETSILVTYFFEKMQELRFRIADNDRNEGISTARRSKNHYR